MPQFGIIAIMAAMSEDIASVSGAGGARELARFLNDYHDRLSDDQAISLMTLGAGLWRRSVELEDGIPEIDTQLAKIQ